MPSSVYRGRFAPSPTGPLHAGSLASALASWLDARAHDGAWLVRIEDVDTPRCVPGADRIILQQLGACGLQPDEPPVYQSQRGDRYRTALDQLAAQSQAFACACSRLDIEVAAATEGQSRARHGELIYPGTCRAGLHGKAARSWRFLSSFCPLNTALDQQIRARDAPDLIADKVAWTDRLLGPQSQNVSTEVGDFVLKRADGLWAYQLAVVVDDAAQGITHVVRGQDLLDNTARQVLLQRALGLPQPQYLHTPLVLGANGEKLSKQNGAAAVSVDDPLAALKAAGLVLGIQAAPTQLDAWLRAATAAWRARL